MNNRDTQKLLNSGEHFESISDFKWCMKRGGEVVFVWNGKTYGAFGKMCKTDEAPEQICILNVDDTKSEMYYDTADEALEFLADGVKLRDIITKVTVIDRTI